MAKFMIQFTYSAEGYKGLLANKAASRDEAVRKLVGSLGGELEVLHWTPTGEYTGVGIVDASHDSAAMFVATVMATGAFTALRATELLSATEVDRALGVGAQYVPPGG